MKPLSKLLNSFLALILVVGLFPTLAFADEGDGGGDFDWTGTDPDTGLPYVTNNDVKNVSATDWMSKLPDDWYVTEINIPGTHDSCTCYYGSFFDNKICKTYGQCQDMKVPEQFEAGIRAMDIRLDYNNQTDWREMEICHGAFNCYTGPWRSEKMRVKHLLEYCDDFLKKHKNEAIFLMLSPEANKAETHALMADMSTYALAHPDKYVFYQKGSKIPTLGEVRGKVVFLDDYEKDGNDYRTTTSYQNEYWDKSYHDSTLLKEKLMRGCLDDAVPQNFFDNRTAGGVSGVWCNQKDLFCYERNRFGEPLVKVVYSSANGMDGKEDLPYIPKSPKDFANAMNKGGELKDGVLSKMSGKKITWTYPWKKGIRYGWVAMDFPTQDTIKRIIATNDKTIFSNTIRVTVEDPSGAFGDLDTISVYAENYGTGKKVDTAKVNWTSSNQFEVTGLPSWPGKTLETRYRAGLDLPAGWSYDSEYVGYKDNGVYEYVFTLQAPDPVTVTFNWDCVSEQSKEKLLDGMHFTATLSSGLTEKTDVPVRGMKIVSDDPFKTVMAVQLFQLAPEGATMDLDVDFPIISGAYYVKDDDYKRIDNEHFEFTFHSVGEKVDLTGTIVFDDDSDYLGYRRYLKDDFWNAIMLTGTNEETGDDAYCVDKSVTIEQSERGKDTVVWTAKVPKVDPKGHEITWNLSKSQPLNGYTRTYSSDGRNLTYKMQPYVMAQIEWKNDTPDMRPESVEIVPVATIDSGEVILGQYEVRSASGWRTGTSAFQGDADITLKVRDIPEEYVVTNTTTEDFCTTIELTWVGALHSVIATGCTPSKTLAHKDEVITVTADASKYAPFGYEFSHWDASDNVTLADETSAETTFVMPDENVSVKAIYVDAYHDIHVTNGSTDGTAKAAKGMRVPLTADPAPDGMKFDCWFDVYGNITYDNATSPNTYFTMPGTEAWIMALYTDDVPDPDSHAIIVANGSADSDRAYEGDTVTISTETYIGEKQFVRWNVVSGNATLADPTSITTTFTMPDEDVRIEAVFKNYLHGITVIDGRGPDKARAGVEISIQANAAPEGKAFACWKCIDGGVTFADPTSPDTTFVMTDEEVTVRAMYDSDFGITVIGGTAVVSEAKQGENVRIGADVPPEGKAFDHWEVVSGDAKIDDPDAVITFFTMPAEDVTLEAVFVDVEYEVAVTNGSATPEKAVFEQEVSLTADDPEEGMRFKEWKVVSGDVTLADATSITTTFAMPADNVEVEATYEAARYVVEVEGGSADADEATYGQLVTVTADAAPAGMQFSRWACVSGSGVYFDDIYSPETIFAMPAEDVKVQAVFTEIPTTEYTINMINGTASQSTAVEGATITIEADPAPDAQQMLYWTDENGEVLFDDEGATTTTFTMPAADVWIRAVYGNAENEIRVVNGAADKATAAVTEVVSLVADPAPDGMEFACWVDTFGNIEYEDWRSPETTFVMPDTDVLIQAEYRIIDPPSEEYAIMVTGGVANFVAAPQGTEVAITAGPIPEGKAFDSWKVVSGDVTLADASSASTTFVMPAEEVELEAVFKDAPADEYSITVEGGTASVATAPQGAEVHISASEPSAGKLFDHWEAVAGDVTFDSATSAFTAFIMPAEDVTVTAVYKDVPADEYSITVEGGTANVATALQGAEVRIVADEPPAGKLFDHWEAVAGDVTFSSATSTFTTFIMPAEDVTVAVVYKDIPAPFEYFITAGNGQTYLLQSGRDLTFTCNGELEKFTELRIDGAVVDASNYTCASGSTIATLKANYLNTLIAGSHTIQFMYVDGHSDQGFFMVKAANADPVAPLTGDASGPLLLTLLAAVALSGAAALWALRRKPKRGAHAK